MLPPLSLAKIKPYQMIDILLVRLTTYYCTNYESKSCYNHLYFKTKYPPFYNLAVSKL